MEHIFLIYTVKCRILSGKSRFVSTSLESKITTNKKISVKKRWTAVGVKKEIENMPIPLQVATHKTPMTSHLWVYIHYFHCHKKSAKQVLSPFPESFSN